jgi:hypothetical protein
MDPGSGRGKKSGSGMNNPGHISESLEIIFWVKIRKFFDACGSRIRDGKNSYLGSGMKKFDSGINIPDPQH